MTRERGARIEAQFEVVLLTASKLEFHEKLRRP